MSFGVVRGVPSAAQRYLDRVLDRIQVDMGVEPSVARRASLSLAQVLFYCMKAHTDQEFMTNGSTGEVIKKEWVLKYAVSIARSLMARGVTGKTVVVAMRNHQRMAAVYFAVLFSGALPYFMSPKGTAYETNYFMELIEPCFVFCDRNNYSTISSCLEKNDKVSADVIVAEEELQLRQFIDGASDDVKSFQVHYTSPDDTILMLPTSGSTGLPKATMMTNKGFIMQLPISWTIHTQFPTPTKRILVHATLQCSTFAWSVSSGVVYQIPILMTPKEMTPDHVAELFLKFRPSWTFCMPMYMKSLLPVVTSEHLSSLDTLMLIGTTSTPDFMSDIKKKLPATAHLYDGYGATETHGYIAMHDKDSPSNSNGRVINILHYKLLDDDGQVVGLCQEGELYVKGECLFKGYYKNESAYADCFTHDGWYKTGDLLYIDENEQLYYRERKHFIFKFMNGHVSSYELECVICTVPGVEESAVCCTEDGPTAAVVLRDGCHVTREQIHRVVDFTLSDHKRLRGGIAFVPSLPQTHSGKLHRGECLKLLKQLVETGQCL